MSKELTTEERLLVWKDVTAHVLAMVLTLGFFIIVILALVGVVNITDPTTATFIGTVTGYAISQLTRPMAWYFNVPRSATRNGSKESHPDTMDTPVT